MPRTKKEDVFPNYIRVNDTDQETLAELTLRAKGERSLSEFARLCGVNPSTLSRLVNQKNSGPCADTLIKSIADNADPDSGVTLDMLLVAHGLAPVVLQSSELPRGISAAIEDTQVDKDVPKNAKVYSCDLDWILTPSEVLIQIDKRRGEDTGSLGSSAAIRRTVKMISGEAFERDSCDIISNILLRKGYMVRLVQESEPKRFDFSIETDALHDFGINEWFFEVKFGNYSAGARFLDKLFRDLYFISMYDEGKAVSLVISDKQAFEGIRGKYRNARIYDYVSVILVDRMNRCVAEEFVFPRKGQEENMVLGVLM